MKTNKFASGGKRPMLGKGDRTRTAYPASSQRAGRTGQHDGKAALKRPSAKVRSDPVDEAGAMGGSRGVSNPRRPAA
jgi:hypothetical protein